MLIERTQLIADETAKIKVELITAIGAKIPKKRLFFSTIKFSELDRGILAADHYNTGYQLSCIITYLENAMSLEAVVKCFKSIVDTGIASAFQALIFNAEVRKVLAELL